MSTKQVRIGPDMRVSHPDFGDITADVAAELQKLNETADAEVYAHAHERQIHIANACGTEGRVLDGNSGMRLIAQIDEDVYNYWEHREGREFWTKKGELDRMLRKHPELAVKHRSNQFSFSSATAPRARSGKGRWATG